MNSYGLVLWWIVFSIIAKVGATKSFYSNKAGSVNTMLKLNRILPVRSLLGK